MRHAYILIFFFTLFEGVINCNTVAAQNNPDTTIHLFADTMPSFPGGKTALYSFIFSRLNYPQEAIKNNVQGKVYLHFVVEPDGTLSNLKVLKGIGSGCDKEALRIASMMPNWKSGWLHGRKVRSSYNLLIPFHLKVVEDPIYLRVDSLPQYHLGNTVMKDYIQQNLVYPVTILKDSIIDTVNVLYVVGKDKSISHVALMKEKKQPDAYDYEAMHLVKNLSVSSPAYLKGKPVSMRLFMPVVFDYRLLDTADVKVVERTYSGNVFSYYQMNTIFVIVEQMPEFSGGMRALMKYLASNLHYPKQALQERIFGKVFIHFIIEPDGSVSHVKVLRGIGGGCDKEAVRVVKSMPKWKPGIQKGKPVRVSFNLPIKFSF